MTPMSFYNTFIESEMNLQNKVLLRHDPRATSPYYRTYHVEHFGSMVGGKPEVAMNVPWEVLSRTAAEAVMNGQQLWFSADMGKCMSFEHGILSTEAYDYAGIMDTTFDMDKASCLDANVSAPTHAMALVGVDVKDDDPTQVCKWKVENSWGESSGGEDPRPEKLILSMNLTPYLYRITMHLVRLLGIVNALKKISDRYLLGKGYICHIR
jgi:bleomycin hydrolase